MAGGGVRAVARAYLVLGVAAAAFALFALSLDPAMFRQLQLQMIKESGPHPPEQGQMDCAATAAEAMEMRADAVVLLMLGAAQVLTAIMAAVGAMGRIRTVLAQLVSLPMAAKFAAVFAGVADLAFGHNVYHDALVFGYVIISVPVALLFVTGLFLALVD